MQRTLEQYDAVVTVCRQLFAAKTRDYGTAWRILRPRSLTDQLYIKARRIRTLEETGQQRIAESVESEYVGLVNYSAMALIQLQLSDEAPLDLEEPEALRLYDHCIAQARDLMTAKNHDYGEAWREMRVSSLTDLILMKLLRIKQIEDNQGKTLVSEGLEANYTDIINYAVFALIRIGERQEVKIVGI